MNHQRRRERYPGSVVLYPARGKDFLDWETISKLCRQNGAFAKFVEDVKIDFEAKRIHKAEYMTKF